MKKAAPQGDEFSAANRRPGRRPAFLLVPGFNSNFSISLPHLAIRLLSSGFWSHPGAAPDRTGDCHQAWQAYLTHGKDAVHLANGIARLPDDGVVITGAENLA